MIIEQEKSNIETNIKKSSTFRIQTGAKAFEILSSNIYKNKVKAVIREISCNAIDAHIAANVDRPIYVHLPTHLETWFSVRDYGYGIPEDKMEEIYTTYFYSDKSHSNDFIGGLGLGTKSPLSLVDSFTVTNYNNGYKMEYLCFKNENKEPQITLLSKKESSEPSGIEVKILTSSALYYEFNIDAVNVYKFFDQIPNINNDRIKKQIEEEKSKIKWIDNFAANSESRIYVVMGNVAYEVPESITDYNLQYGVYIRAEIGEVNFDPGREYVTLDKKTKEYLKAKIDSIFAKMESIARAELDSLKTPFERGKLYTEKYSSLKLKKLHQDYIQKVPDFVMYKRNHDRFFSYRLKELEYGDNVAYCYSPKGRQLIHKIKHLLANGYNKVCMLDEKHPVDYIPSNVLINLDEYKINNITATRTYNSVSMIGKVFELQVSALSNFSDVRQIVKKQAIDLSSIPEEERFVIPFYSDYICEFNTIIGIEKILNQAKKFVKVPDKVYFVHSVTYESKKFKASKYRNLADYIKDECSNLSSSFYYSENESVFFGLKENLSKINSSCKVIKAAQKMVDDAAEKYKMKELLKFVGATEVKSITEEVQKSLERAHPIFKLVHMTKACNSEIKVIKEYV